MIGFARVLFVISLQVLYVKSQSCAINITQFPRDTKGNFHEPIILRASRIPSRNIHEFTHPNQDGDIEFNHGEHGIISCAGASNNLWFDQQKKEAGIRCVGGDHFAITDHVPNILEAPTFANCSAYNRASIRETNIECGDKAGVIIRIGFELNPFLDLYHVCYNQRTTSPVYALHTLHGESMKMNGVQNRDFKRDGIAIDMDGTYKNQTRRLEEIFNHGFSDSFDKGHLAPYADFSMQSWQLASNFYINSFPQWNTTNRGNWLTVENSVREHAKKARSQLTIYTGIHENLILESHKIDLYLGRTSADHRVPVPKYVWKVVLQDDGPTRYGIAFVTLNNPFIAPDVKIPNFCNNICLCNGWANQLFTDRTKGYTICCSVKEMGEKIKNIKDLNLGEPQILKKA